MRFFLLCSDMIIPVIILGIVCYGVTRHVDVYESFIKGANSGFQTVIKIMPTMLALMIAVGILRASQHFLLHLCSDVISYGREKGCLYREKRFCMH